MMFSLYQPSIIFVYRVINFSVKEKISSVEGQNRENITIFSFFMMLICYFMLLIAAFQFVESYIFVIIFLLEVYQMLFCY